MGARLRVRVRVRVRCRVGVGLGVRVRVRFGVTVRVRLGRVEVDGRAVAGVHVFGAEGADGKEEDEQALRRTH